MSKLDLTKRLLELPMERKKYIIDGKYYCHCPAFQCNNCKELAGCRRINFSKRDIELIINSSIIEERPD